MKIELAEKLLNHQKTVSFQAFGQSMLPSIQDGEEVVLSSKAFQRYDVVLAKLRDDFYVLHRIVLIDHDMITLKGDHLDQTETIHKSKILGVYEDGFYHVIQSKLFQRNLVFKNEILFKKHEMMHFIDGHAFNDLQTFRDSLVIEVLQAFHEHHINYIVLKGYAIDHLYDHPYHRTKGDLDVYVFKEDFKRAESILISKGYVKLKADNAIHESYKKLDLNVELHFKLDDEYPIEMNQEDIQELLFRSQYPYPVLNNQKQYIHLLIHMKKHMKTSGIGLKHVLDLYYLLKKERPNQTTLETMKTYLIDKLFLYVEAMFLVLEGLEVPPSVHLDKLWIFMHEIKKHGVHGVLDKRVEVKKSTSSLYQTLMKHKHPIRHILQRLRDQGLKTTIYKLKKYYKAKKDVSYQNLLKEIFND